MGLPMYSQLENGAEEFLSSSENPHGRIVLRRPSKIGAMGFRTLAKFGEKTIWGQTSYTRTRFSINSNPDQIKMFRIQKRRSPVSPH